MDQRSLLASYVLSLLLSSSTSESDGQLSSLQRVFVAESFARLSSLVLLSQYLLSDVSLVTQWKEVTFRATSFGPHGLQNDPSSALMPLGAVGEMCLHGSAGN